MRARFYGIDTGDTRTASEIIESHMHETHIRILAGDAEECRKAVLDLNMRIRATDGEYDARDKGKITDLLSQVHSDLTTVVSMLKKMKNKDDK